MENQQETQSTSSYDRRNTRTILYIIAIALLVCANIYLYVKYNQKDNNEAKAEAKVYNDSISYVALQADYSKVSKDLDSYKGKYASLDSVVNIKDADIKKWKEKFDAAIRNNKISKADYEKLIAELNQEKADLMDRITKLEKEKGVLITRNDSLGKVLVTQVDENGKLKEQNKLYGKRAGLLNAVNFNATGIIMKSKGKEKETTSAKRAEKIKVCFDIDKSPAPDAGTKTLMLRIVSPEGVTIDNQQSGVFDLAEGQDQKGQMKYSIKQDIDYQQKKQNVCMYWSGTAGGFGKGKYTVEVYQDGYKIGSKDFTLK
jgi:hypothetical protein